MTEPQAPRWSISFKLSEPGSRTEKMVIEGSDMVAALKRAQMMLAEWRVADPQHRPYKITLIEVAEDAPDVPHPVGEAPALATI